ncbi:hypothetical protein LLG46_07130 [bacterium]|nr:hypothetical protein [bacterium]
MNTKQIGLLLLCFFIGLTVGLLPSQPVAWKTHEMERQRHEAVLLLTMTGVGQAQEDVHRWLGKPNDIYRNNLELTLSNPGVFVPTRPVQNSTVWFFSKDAFVVYVYMSPSGTVQTSYVVPRENWRSR